MIEKFVKPCILFLYTIKECADVLGRDGLHLSRVGGRHCSQVIEEDVYSWSEIAYQQDVHWNEDIRQPHSAEIDASSFDQWYLFQIYFNSAELISFLPV